MSEEPDVYYVVAIDGWDWGYSLSLNADRQPSTPTTNSAIFRSGPVAASEGAEDGPDHPDIPAVKDFDPQARMAVRPLLVGSLDDHGDPITGLLSLPEDPLSPILQMMIAFRLEMKLDPDDLPEGA